MNYIKYKSDNGDNLFSLREEKEIDYKGMNSMYDLDWWAHEYSQDSNIFSFKNEYDRFVFELSNTLSKQYSLVSDWKDLLQKIEK